MAAKPKTTVKRKSTSVRVAKKKRSISKLQAIVLVGVLAAIGVVAVALTRASGTPNYQYSWNKYCVSAYGKDSAKDVADCKNTSAEAMVYRMYRGLYDRNPDVGAYKFWTQKLAGDRQKVVSAEFVAARTPKLGSDTAYIKTLYTDMLLRDAKASEVDYWVGKLKASGDKRWSRPKVALHFAASNEAIKSNQERWNSFVATAPTVTVTQTAAAEQRKRFDRMLTEYQQPNKKDMESATKLVTKAEEQLQRASSTAAKKAPSSNDLKAIAANQYAAQDYYNLARGYEKSSKKRLESAQRSYDQAKDLASYALDIGGNSVYGISKIGDRLRAAKTYANTTAAKPQQIATRINSISAKYKVAEKNYQIEQKRIRDAKAAEQARADAERERNVDEWTAAVRNQDCYKYSYSVQGTASGRATYNGQYVVLYDYRDVVLSGKGANTTGCKSTSTGFNYKANEVFGVGRSNGPHYPANTAR